MLLSTFSTAKRNLIAGVTAVSVLAAGTSPALAWGKPEQQFLAGIAATLLVQKLIADSPRYGTQPAPVYRYQRYNPHPVYYTPAPVSIYGTPTAQAFNSYSSDERRRIQSTLSAYGYYHSTIDGAFGPNTYSAISAYARHVGKTAMLGTRAGAYTLLDGLLF